MNKNPTLPPLPRVLQMPLRDALRGLASFAEVTEEILSPAKSAVPDPVRAALRTALKTIEGKAEDMLGSRIGFDDIQHASTFMRGAGHDARDVGCCAAVLAFAWDKMQTGGTLHPLLSETLTSSRLSLLHNAETGRPSDHAAAVLGVLRASHVAGGFPGMSMDIAINERDVIDLRLFAFAIWLLADRGNSFEEDMQLLDMAMALTRAFEADVLAAMPSPDRLAVQLHDLSEHL